MKISEKELKQIIVEALQEGELDEGIMDKLRGIKGGIKSVGGLAKDTAKAAGSKVAGAYGKGSYEDTKKSTIASARADLGKLSDAAGKYEKDEKFLKTLEDAVTALDNLEPDRVATPTLDAVDTSASQSRIAARREKAAADAAEKEKADADTTDSAGEEAATDDSAGEEAAGEEAAGGEAAAEEPAAAAEEPAAAAEEKPQINVFRGKGGKGVQSQMAKAGVKGKDMSRIMKGLKGDLTGAGFDVLEEASRREISLEKTLKAIDQIADPAQKEAAKKIIVKLLKKNKVKVSDARLKKAAPAQEPAAAKEPAAGEEYPEGHKMAGFTKPKRVEPKAETPEQKKKRQEDEMWAERGLNEGQISRFAKLAGLL